jgi:putative ABC transport system permease protein
MTQILESIVIAVQAIWANKLRSFMTVLGNIVAVTSIVTVVSLIQGINAAVNDAIVGRVGADTFTIQRIPPVTTQEQEEEVRNNPRLSVDEADAIRRFSPAIGTLMVQAQQRGNVTYRSQTMERVRILGVSPEYVNFGNFDAERGRMLTASEVERNRPVVLLGAQTAEGLFGDVSPLDKTISVEGIHFLVVGVSAAKGTFLGNTQDDVAVIPMGLHTKLFGARQQLTFIAKPVTPDRLQEAMDAATVALRVERRLKASERDNFGIFTSSTLLGIYEQATNGIFAVLIGVVALSLLVGGIVIMNIMLMVVSERTREIGLRKALGARRADIMSQVLTESVTLSTIGGLAGIALGYLVAQGLAAVSPLPAVFEPWSVALGIGITAIVGLFFGAYPASRAAALDPIEALRRE